MKIEHMNIGKLPWLEFSVHVVGNAAGEHGIECGIAGQVQHLHQGESPLGVSKDGVADVGQTLYNPLVAFRRRRQGPAMVVSEFDPSIRSLFDLLSPRFEAYGN